MKTANLTTLLLILSTSSFANTQFIGGDGTDNFIQNCIIIDGHGTSTPIGGDGTGAPIGGDGTGAPIGGDGTGAPIGGDGTGAPIGGDGTGTPYNPNDFNTNLYCEIIEVKS